MGRYYNGDINGKFMFAVQSSSAGERFGAFEIEPQYVEYSVNRESYEHIKKTLKKIENSGAVERVKNMFENENYGWNEKIKNKYNVSDKDISDYADWILGCKMKLFFDENKEEDDLFYSAEI
jgi:hypothetical protein